MIDAAQLRLPRFDMLARIGGLGLKAHSNGCDVRGPARAEIRGERKQPRFVAGDQDQGCAFVHIDSRRRRRDGRQGV